MKPVRYTRHARNRMRWHKIGEDEVESAIKNPEFLEPTFEGRLNAWIKVSEKYLRVTYREEDDKFTVITAPPFDSHRLTKPEYTCKINDLALRRIFGVLL